MKTYLLQIMFKQMKLITTFHLKKTDNKFDGDKEVEKFKIFFVKYDSAAEGWHEIKFRIEKAPTLFDFDFELVVFSTRDNAKLIF